MTDNAKARELAERIAHRLDETQDVCYNAGYGKWIADAIGAMLPTLTEALAAERAATIQRMKCGHLQTEWVKEYAALVPDESPNFKGLTVPGYCKACQREAAAFTWGAERAKVSSSNVLTRAVAHHRAMNGPHDFCEDYGCSSLEDFAKEILTEPLPQPAQDFISRIEAKAEANAYRRCRDWYFCRLVNESCPFEKWAEAAASRAEEGKE